MWYLSESDLLFRGGIALMAGSAVLSVLCLAVFSFTGKKLKKTLEEEYGKPRQ